MRQLLFIIISAVLLLLVTGCSKDEEVSDLEKEIKEAEGRDYLADKVPPEADTALADNAVVDTGAGGAEALTPEETPPEERTEAYRAERGGYSIQVAAGTMRENADYLRDKYIMRGYEAYITPVEIEGQSFYRVRIGNFENYAEAKLVAAELQDHFSAETWIDLNQ